eukprot:1820440-Lingulodinium_polyedra.AAC.1
MARVAGGGATPNAKQQLPRACAGIREPRNADQRGFRGRLGIAAKTRLCCMPASVPAPAPVVGFTS